MANADLWRTLKNEFRGLSDYEHRLVPDPADSRRLSAYGDYTGGNATGQWHVSDGVSPDLRTWFEDLATRAGSELNIPPGVEALLFWLHCLAKFLADHESPYRDSGYLAVWDPRRVAIVREPAAASAVYCSYLAKESAAGQVAGSFRAASESPARAGKRTARGISRRATCDLGVEEVRHQAKQMRADGASHREICQRLGNAPRPARAAWGHLPWDKAYREPRFHSSVCKWLSRHCQA